MVKSHPPFRLRQIASQNVQRNSKKQTKKNKTNNTKSEENLIEMAGANLIFLSPDVAFKVILLVRFCSAMWCHITDCDETFNYWEPTHFLVYGKGLQTWEYSPQYALRSYFYLMIHATPMWIYQRVFHPNPLYLFSLLRCLFALICSFAEVYFYKAICKEFGVHVGRICLFFQLLSPGMYISCTAFLPSSFAMYNITVACSAWWQQKYALAIFYTALASLLGWPFAALLGLPIAIDMLFIRKLYKDFIFWSIVSALIIGIPMITVDSMLYGKLVIAPYNIIKYNVFGGAGPELYGTEPFSFYLINGFLNFNIIWILSLISPIAILLHYLLVPAKYRSTLYLPEWFSLSPLYLWLVVFMFQNHKEERFLFPVYPLICLAAAISLDIIQKLYFRILSLYQKMPHGTHYLNKSTFIMVIALCICSILGISRVFALFRNYHAPQDVLMDVNSFPAAFNVSNQTEINVCLGKEWHRYQSSFFLPNTKWNVRFIKSEFNGMIPAPYSQGLNATSIIHTHFNDENKEVKSLYTNIFNCHFLLDFDNGKETDLEPLYHKMKDNWRILTNYTFLNSELSNRYARAFYLPFISDRFTIFGDYYLLQSLDLEIIQPSQIQIENIQRMMMRK